MVLKESPDPSSPFSILKASISKFRNDRDDQRTGRDESTGLRRSSVDVSRRRYEAVDTHQSKAHRPTSAPIGFHNSTQARVVFPCGPSSQQFHSSAHRIQRLVEGISDPLYPIESRIQVHSEWPPARATTSSPPVVPPPGDIRKPDPRLVIDALGRIPHIGASKAHAQLDVHEQMIIHQLDQIDAEERNLLRFNTSQPSIPGSSSSIFSSATEGQPRTSDDTSAIKELSTLSVFGVSLRKSSIYASTSVLLGGRELELPIVVVSCVEELYRTGLYQPNLFRTLPNPCRLRELADAFNHEGVPADIIVTPRPKAAKRRLGTAFGEHISLHLEATADICSLLSTYLMSLPEPIVIPGNGLFDAMWEWCGLDESNDEMEEVGRVPYDGKPVPFVQVGVNRVPEKDRIRAAQLLLHLLPSPNFDLLVYLLAFFTQVVLVQKENGVGSEDLGKMFGECLFGKVGGGVEADAATGSEGQGGGHGVRMMCWLLRRWDRLSHQLFNVPMLLHGLPDLAIQNPNPPDTVPVLRHPAVSSYVPPLSSILSSVQGGGSRVEVGEGGTRSSREVGLSTSEDGAPTISDTSSTYTYPKDGDTSQPKDVFGTSVPPTSIPEGEGDQNVQILPSTRGERRARPPAEEKDSASATKMPLAYLDLGRVKLEEGERQGVVDNLMDDLIDSYRFVDTVPFSMKNPSIDDLAEVEQEGRPTVEGHPRQTGNPRVATFPLHVKGKQEFVEVNASAAGRRDAIQSGCPSVMVPVLSLRHSDTSVESTTDLCARLMEITMSDLISGPDPTAILNSSGDHRRKTTRIPSLKKSLQTQSETAIGQRLQRDHNVRRTSVHQLEEELQLVKKQNAQALGTLEKTTKQISSLEAKLKDIEPEIGTQVL